MNYRKKYKEKIYLPFSHLFNAYSKSINKTYNRTGSLFQEHLNRIKIDNENYLKQLVVYIHLNPVKHKLSADFKKYFHSSYRSYLSDKDSAIEREYILNLFGDKENFIVYHDETKIKQEGIIADINTFDE